MSARESFEGEISPPAMSIFVKFEKGRNIPMTDVLMRTSSPVTR